MLHYVSSLIVLLIVQLGLSQTAQEYLDAGKDQMENWEMETAINSFKSALEINPSLAEAHYLIGVAKNRENPYNGLEDFEKAISLDSNTAEYYSKAATVFGLDEKFPKKKVYYVNKAYELDPNYRNTIIYARLIRLENPEKAISLYTQLIDQQGNDHEVWSVLQDRAKMFLAQGKFKEAIIDFEKAYNNPLAEMPGENLEFIGDAYFGIGDVEKACQIWNTAIPLFIDEPSQSIKDKIAQNCQ